MAVSCQLANDSVLSHSFNGDRTELAVSINTNLVYILSVPKSPSSKYQVIDVLKEHNALVTGIDWAPKSNRIVTCSVDHDAYVWNKQSDGRWKPTLVVLMIDRAAVCVKWSPLENQIAVGSGSKMVSICTYEEIHDWWISIKIKKPIKSTVTCLDWHPGNEIIACGSTDFRVRVFSTITNKEKVTTWGNLSSQGTMLFDHYDGDGGWVLSCSFSADGNKLLWCKHNSIIYIADSSNGSVTVVSHRTNFLPFTSCVWIGPSTFVAAGYDCCPMVYNYVNKSINFVHQLIVKNEPKMSNKLTAMKMFQDIDRMATTENTSAELETIHQNCINEIRIMDGTKLGAKVLSSVGRDGKLVIWNIPSLCSQFADLKII